MVFAFKKFRPHLIGSHVIVLLIMLHLMHLLSRRDVISVRFAWII